MLDSAGKKEYSSFLDQYLRHGQGFIIVYSVTSRISFNFASKYREKIYLVKDMESKESIPIILVGNKIDLEDEREVKTT